MQEEINSTQNIKLHVVSDIHLEFYKTLPKLEKRFLDIDPTKINILCLCGDIGYPHTKIYKWFITWCSEHFTKVFIITGNHEYYSSKYTVSEINRQLAYLAQKYPNVTFLNNSTEIYEGYLFIGTTLWSDLTQIRTEKTRWYDFNDFNQIRYTDEEILTPHSYCELHKSSLTWLLATLQKEKENPLIVLTHHLPTYRAIHQEYQESPYNPLFATQLDHIFKEYPNIVNWFAGHTHKPVEIHINNTHLIVNPIGYPRENPHITQWNKIVDAFRGNKVQQSAQEEDIEFI